MHLTDNNWLVTAAVFLPLLGAFVVMALPKSNEYAIKVAALVTSLATLGIGVAILSTFDYSQSSSGLLAGKLQFYVNTSWIPVIKSRYIVGVDGLGLPLLILSMVIVVLVVIYSWDHIPEPGNPKAFFALILILEVGMNGTFVAQDLILFFVFFEVVLLPMYFMIGVWGGDNRRYAAIKFFLYTLFGSALMLLAFLALFFKTGSQSFAIEYLAAHSSGILHSTQLLIFGGLFMGFAIKVPMFPFHTWLPDAHTEAPTQGSVILAAVMRARIIHIVIVLSLIGIIYGALVCLMQKDMKRLIAYSSVSHLGFCTLGIFALTPNGLAGSVLQQINHGISTGALFLIVGVLYERRHTRMISEFGGLATPMPNFAAIYLIVSLSSLGMPLLNGFIGEFTILQGAFQVSKAWAAWGSLGVVLGAAYLLWLYQRVMFGPVTQFANEELPDLNLREYATLVPLVILAFWIGIYPKPFFALIEKPVQKIVEQVNPNFYQAERAKLPPAELHAAAAETK